jgi:recombination protein RecA
MNTLSAAERIEKKFGGKWEKAGSGILKPPASISTGSILMDQAIGDCKGYPEGSIIEIYGPQHSGKTLMGYLAIASSQRKNAKKDHLIIDAENQFRFQSRWAKQVGVDVPNLYVKPVTSGEEAFDIIEMAILGDVKINTDGEVAGVVEPGNFGIIMVDSVTQLVPLEMIHKGMDESQRMASVAAMMSRGLKKILSAMVISNSKTIIIFINQVRMNPQPKYGANPENRTGGMALPFYNTISFRVSKVRKSEERDERGMIFAHQAKVKFDKNKAGGLPADPIIIRICYDGTGIDQDAELASVAELNGIIKEVKKGKFNFFKPGTDDLLDNNIENFKRDDFRIVLDQHKEIKDLIYKFIQEGKFYSTSEVEEDNPEVEELSDAKKVMTETVGTENLNEKTNNETVSVSVSELEEQTTRKRRKVS